jgi:hypothetical protein
MYKVINVTKTLILTYKNHNFDTELANMKPYMTKLHMDCQTEKISEKILLQLCCITSEKASI